MAQVFGRVEGEWAGKAAIDIALMDWVGQKLGVPLYRYFGLDPRDAPVTTFSIGIDTPEITRQKMREAADFPVLKIKVGLDTDEATIEAVRSVTNKPLRVDANEGWKDKEEAVRKINWLDEQGVEFMEQPMPAEMMEETRWVRSRVHLPIIADEACRHASRHSQAGGRLRRRERQAGQGGGILEAHRMIQVAKSLGMKTMLGCMVSSSVSVTAAAHLSPLVDYADLDGNLLIANDPFTGVQGGKGQADSAGRAGAGAAGGVRGRERARPIDNLLKLRLLAPQKTRYKTTSPGPTHTEIWAGTVATTTPGQGRLDAGVNAAYSRDRSLRETRFPN